jgi:hypothetical protein
MRSYIIFEELDASVEQVSQEFNIDCGQDMRWLAQFKITGSNGEPKICIEESINHRGTKIWTVIPNYGDDEGLFPMDKEVIGIRDSYFMGRLIRFTYLPGNNTSGTIYAQLGEKTKSV